MYFKPYIMSKVSFTAHKVSRQEVSCTHTRAGTTSCQTARGSIARASLAPCQSSSSRRTARTCLGSCGRCRPVPRVTSRFEGRGDGLNSTCMAPRFSSSLLRSRGSGELRRTDARRGLPQRAPRRWHDVLARICRAHGAGARPQGTMRDQKRHASIPSTQGPSKSVIDPKISLRPGSLSARAAVELPKP